MFAYNKECKTKQGEFLTPILGEGEFILCSNRRGETVYRKAIDFDMAQKKENRIIVAVPKPSNIVKEIVKERVMERETVQAPIVLEPILVKKEEKVLQIVKKTIFKEKDSQHISKKMEIKNKDKSVSKDNDGYDEEYI